MTGYQEILTDPSYHGQIVAMTYPQIGNYGINLDDGESGGPRLAGFVVRELARRASNYRSRIALEDYLAQHGVPGIQGIDTRALTLALRSAGAMKAVLSTADLDDRSLIAKAKASRGLVGRDLAKDVMPSAPREWTDRTAAEWGFIPTPGAGSPHHVVALDFGMKWNIGRCLVESGCAVTVMPGSASAKDILDRKPEGVFVSNGPGDPEPLGYAVETLRKLIPEVPIFGICLGHQLLGQALGAKTFKLKFGHRGANQPVRNERTGKVEITTQNHGFAVDVQSLPGDVQPTYIVELNVQVSTQSRMSAL